jgi:Holliday junction resolvasome RuvABC endonuclease subunit
MGRALVVDMSYTAVGWLVADLGHGIPEPIIAQGFIKTGKDGGAASTVEDDVRRIGEILRPLTAAADKYEVCCLIVEPMCGKQGYRAGKTVGVVASVIAALCERRELPWIRITPQASKKAVCDNKAASKEAVQAVVSEEWPEVNTWEGYEHCCDALAALVAARPGQLYRMAALVGEPVAGGNDSPQQAG